MSKSYELIVFDWDGTLMDSEVRIVTCMQLAAQDCAIAVPSAVAVREIIGLGMREAVDRLFEPANEQASESIIEAYRTHWLGDQIPHSALFPGAQALLEALTEQGYLLAVATGKSRRGLDKVLDESGLASYFHATRCADETFSKPHPQMLEEILTDLDTAPDRALVIGDSEYDMQMASNARVDALGVDYGVHGGERLRQQGALQVLSDLKELTDWLAGS